MQTLDFDRTFWLNRISRSREFVEIALDTYDCLTFLAWAALNIAAPSDFE